MATLGNVAQAKGMQPPRCAPVEVTALKAAPRVSPVYKVQKLPLKLAQLAVVTTRYCEGLPSQWMQTRDKTLYCVGSDGAQRGRAIGHHQVGGCQLPAGRRRAQLCAGLEDGPGRRRCMGVLSLGRAAGSGRQPLTLWQPFCG